MFLIFGGEAARLTAAGLLAVGAVVWLPLLSLSLSRVLTAVAGVGQERDETVARARAEWLMGVVSAEGLATVAGALTARQHSTLHLHRGWALDLRWPAVSRDTVSAR